jgi:hypothetical protein
MWDAEAGQSQVRRLGAWIRLHSWQGRQGHTRKCLPGHTKELGTDLTAGLGRGVAIGDRHREWSEEPQKLELRAGGPSFPV